MAKKKKNKLRADFRKKHESRARHKDFTRDFAQDNLDRMEAPYQERVSGKGELTRKRTVIGGEADSDQETFAIQLDVDHAECRPGRVLGVHGLTSTVQGQDGRQLQCSTRGLLKSLSTEQRQVVAAGDRVFFSEERRGEGVIERIEPRSGVLSRSSRGRQHVIVANVDFVLIVGSAAEPKLKPNLIDRFLVTAEKTGLRPIVCINKIDLVNPADLQPLAGVYAQMGYHVRLVSATEGAGIPSLARLLRDRETVIVGQSGVGKSSLLNAIDPGLALRVRSVSTENQKGRHTTTTARLIPLAQGGYVVDTPGIRQFQLWDVIPEEVSGFYRDIRPYVSLCRFPDCTHTHESFCAVKDAVADGRIDVRRYESYCYLHAGDE